MQTTDLTLLGPCTRLHPITQQMWRGEDPAYPGLVTRKEGDLTVYISDREFAFTEDDKLPQRVIRANRMVVLDGDRYVGDLGPLEFGKHFRLQDPTLAPEVQAKFTMAVHIGEIDAAFSLLSKEFDTLLKNATTLDPTAVEVYEGVHRKFQGAYRMWHYRSIGWKS